MIGWLTMASGLLLVGVLVGWWWVLREARRTVARGGRVV